MLSFSCFSFDALSKERLYEVLKLRQKVFVVEQNCPYLDVDGEDPYCHHLLGMENGDGLMAYARLLPAGHPTGSPHYSTPERRPLLEYPGIGRIVTDPEVRGKGYGRQLVAESIRQIEDLFGRGPIRIQAQEYLLRFYRAFGFEPVGEPYLEDDIPHVDMIRG